MAQQVRHVGLEVRQPVVAALPSSRPAAASTNTPEQIVAMRAPRAWAATRRRSSAGDGATSTPCQPGMMIVSARASMAMPCGTSTETPPAARTAPLRSAQTANRYQSIPSSGRASENISTAQPNSNVHRLS